MSSKYQRLAAAPTGPHPSEDLGHGYNAAMWTACAMGILSGAVGTWAVVVLSPVLGIASAVIAVLALVAGVVLSRMGFGTYTNESIDTGQDSASVGIK